MSLPLLKQAETPDPRFVVSGARSMTPAFTGRGADSATAWVEQPQGVLAAGLLSGLIPDRKPGPGEQYRFHFDMARCIGCKCCEVACIEQNNNPPTIRWRRVGEIEAGEFPLTQRFHLSMGCNHCLDAACLKGCPVGAYHKDPHTGIVLHSAETCIGCQYCTWNCPYGVPQYNPERGVVGKCDLCYHRLAQNLEPACVGACPEQAIRVEIVNVEEWRQTYSIEANAPGMPEAETTISTTRISLPKTIQTGFQKADSHRIKIEDAHWPLVLMLVLTQLSVGALAAVFLTHEAASGARGAVAAAAIGLLALAASTFHLGRPIFAYRALKMWRRSWLSREVLSFSLFAFASSAYAGALWLQSPVAPMAGAAAVVTGLLGVLASSCIYLVPARPAWNSWTTPVAFYLTAVLAGSAFATAILGAPKGWVGPAAAAAVAATELYKYVRLRRASEWELRQSARLLSGALASTFRLRLLLLAMGAALAALGSGWLLWLAFALLLAGEIAGRYLFFVSVVAKNMALGFFRDAEEDAA